MSLAQERIVGILREHGPMTSRQLREHVGLSSVTEVTRSCKGLLRYGIVEADRIPSRGGGFTYLWKIPGAAR